MPHVFTILFALLFSCQVFSVNAEDEECREVRFADIGWTDIAATTAVANEIMLGLNYEPKVSILSGPVTYAGIKNNDVDIFLGNWMPSGKKIIDPFLEEGSLIQLHKNLANGRYTLAVPDYVYEAGVKSYHDLNRFRDKFSGQLYGIEPGNGGNGHILSMIKKNDFNLGKWELVESSEQGMLVAVKQAVAKKEFIVFLGWAPHPMNLAVNLKYLSGGDAYFGPDLGDSSVYTITKPDYAERCPNLGNFFKQLTFTTSSENILMHYILDEKMSPQKAAQRWLGENIPTVTGWLENIKTYDGRPGIEGFKEHLLKVNNFSKSQTFYRLPIGTWVDNGVYYLTTHFSSQFRTFSSGLEMVINWVVKILLALPAFVLMLLFCALTIFLHRSIWLGVVVLIGSLLIMNLGLWAETVQTLVMVLMAALFSVFVGTPIGILAARKNWFYHFIHPILDLMQTIPVFVYLIPTLMLFGLGVVPGLISTIIFAIPAPIRMTYLGLKSVPVDLVEVSNAFGATSWQTLVKVEIPHALPSMMAGLTQCVMLSLSMVVVAALVGSEGLGTPVVRALNTVNIKQGFESGLAIVILAVLLDRILNFSRKKSEATQGDNA